MLRVHCAVPELRSAMSGHNSIAFGGHSEGETPGPIPNPEAKPFSADGTAWVTAWESRTPPAYFLDEGPPGGPRRVFHEGAFDARPAACPPYAGRAFRHPAAVREPACRCAPYRRRPLLR